MNESSRTCEWVMSHVWVSHDTPMSSSYVFHMNESRHSCEWVMSHTHVPCLSASWHTNEFVISQLWVNRALSHVTRVNTSCHTYEYLMPHIWRRQCVMSHICTQRRVTHMNAPVHTCEYVMSLVWTSLCHPETCQVYMAHSHVRQYAFMCVTCPVLMCDMTHCLLHMCDMTHSYMWHDSFTCGTWLIHIFDMTHLHVGHDSFRCGTWLIHMRDMTQR